MSDTHMAKASITIHAPAADVWEGLTNPALIKQYFFGTETACDWKVGSRITFSGVWEGKPYQDKGTILALEKNKFLKYNYWSSFSGKEDIPANYANVTYELSDQGKDTVLTITQDQCASVEAADHSASNWAMILEGLAKLVERQVSAPQ